MYIYVYTWTNISIQVCFLICNLPFFHLHIIFWNNFDFLCTEKLSYFELREGSHASQAASRPSKANGKACGQTKCLFFGLQQMGPDGFNQTPVWVPEGQAQRCGEEMLCVPSPQLSSLWAQPPVCCWHWTLEPFPASELLGIDFLSAHSWLLHFQSSFKGHSKIQRCIYMFQILHNTFRGASAQLLPAHFYHNPVQKSSHTFLPWGLTILSGKLTHNNLHTSGRKAFAFHLQHVCVMESISISKTHLSRVLIQFLFCLCAPQLFKRFLDKKFSISNYPDQALKS